MIIINKTESRQQCTEAGWYAYDYVFQRNLVSDDILRFKELGADFIYLKGLKQPFFKIEDKYYMIKGVEGKSAIRLSVYKEYEKDITEKIEQFIEECL